MFNSCDIEYLFNVTIKMNLKIRIQESTSLVKCTMRSTNLNSIVVIVTSSLVTTALACENRRPSRAKHLSTPKKKKDVCIRRLQ